MFYEAFTKNAPQLDIRIKVMLYCKKLTENWKVILVVYFHSFNTEIWHSMILQVDLYLLPQAAFPTGGLYFKNKTWVQETKGMNVIIHNNYITGFEKKIKRFQDYGLWLVDDHAQESPLGKL